MLQTNRHQASDERHRAPLVSNRWDRRDVEGKRIQRGDYARCAEAIGSGQSSRLHAPSMNTTGLLVFVTGMLVLGGGSELFTLAAILDAHARCSPKIMTPATEYRGKESSSRFSLA